MPCKMRTLVERMERFDLQMNLLTPAELSAFRLKWSITAFLSCFGASALIISIVRSLS